MIRILHGRRRIQRLVRFVVLLLVVSIGQVSTPLDAAAAETSLPDFPVANGHFFSQASGKGSSYGFTITDNDVHFYSGFESLGGTNALGYPASDRFLLDGLPAQATQKSILQWRPDQGHVVLVNIFDLFTSRGLDGTLQLHQIPPTQDNAADAGLPWSAVVNRHLALLDADPAIKARYFSDPDPIQHFGLPQGSGNFDGVFVIRCERAAFQHWHITTPFARPGEVTQVNAGDLAKEVGLVPAGATEPVPGSDVLVTPLGLAISANDATQSAARTVARDGVRSLVRLDVTFPSGSGIGSGLVLDQNGDILTNEHVVDLATSVEATFANGVRLPARVIGIDLTDDLAVVGVSSGSIGPGVTPAQLASGTGLRKGEPVVALGFSPFFPTPPATRLGIYQETRHTTVDILSSDTYVLPGDSGGPLLDLTGKVVGINSEVRFSQEPKQPLIALSIDASQARAIADRIVTGDSTPEAYLGAETISVTPSVEASLGLTTATGALVVGITLASPAEQAGMTPGVVIVRAGDRNIRTSLDLRDVVAHQPAGGKLSLTVVGPTSRRQVTVVLGAWPFSTGRS